MDILILFMVALMAYIMGASAGWRAREHHAKEVSMKLMERVAELQQQDDEERIHITIEHHNGMMFVYNKKDSSFMAQGKNKEELETILNSRFPGKRFAASEEELQKAGLLS